MNKNSSIVSGKILFDRLKKKEKVMDFKMDRSLFQLDGGLYFDLRHYFLYVFPHHSRLLRRLLKGATFSPQETPPPGSGWPCGDGASANLTARARREAKEQRRIKAALENERSTPLPLLLLCRRLGWLSLWAATPGTFGGGITRWRGTGQGFLGDFSP